MDTVTDPRDELVAELVELRSMINAAEARSAEIAADLAAIDDGHPLGCRSTTQFLSWQAGLSTGAARAVSDAGEALGAFPSLARAAHAGQVSVWQVRAIGSAAADDAEAAGLLEIARHGTCAQLERACRRLTRLRRSGGDADATAHRGRRCRAWWTTAGTFRLDAELAPEAGALVATALDEATDQVPAAASTDADDPESALRADGLELVARRFLDEPAGRSSASPPPGQLSVHIGLPALTGEPARDGADPTLADLCRLGWQGVGVSEAMALRLGCDSTLQAVVRDADGNPLALGRTRRVVNRRLRRALHNRDGGQCRAPGCDASHHLVAHHIVHWAHGGGTDLDNLVLVCPWHHRLVHDGQLAVATHGGRVVITPPGDPPPEPLPRPEITGRVVDVATQRGIAPEPDAASSQWDGTRIDWWCFDAAYDPHPPEPPDDERHAP